MFLLPPPLPQPLHNFWTYPKRFHMFRVCLSVLSAAVVHSKKVVSQVIAHLPVSLFWVVNNIANTHILKVIPAACAYYWPSHNNLDHLIGLCAFGRVTMPRVFFALFSPLSSLLHDVACHAVLCGVLRVFVVHDQCTTHLAILTQAFSFLQPHFCLLLAIGFWLGGKQT